MRYVMGTLLGTGVAIAMIGLMEAIGGRLWPLPAGVNFSDPVALKAAMNSMPLAAMWWVVAGYAVGGLFGAFLARKIGGGVSAIPSTIVGAVLVAACSYNNAQLSQPSWMNVASIISPIAAVTIGLLLAAPRRA